MTYDKELKSYEGVFSILTDYRVMPFSLVYNLFKGRFLLIYVECRRYPTSLSHMFERNGTSLTNTIIRFFSSSSNVNLLRTDSIASFRSDFRERKTCFRNDSLFVSSQFQNFYKLDIIYCLFGFSKSYRRIRKSIRFYLLLIKKNRLKYYLRYLAEYKIVLEFF